MEQRAIIKLPGAGDFKGIATRRVEQEHVSSGSQKKGGSPQCVDRWTRCKLAAALIGRKSLPKHIQPCEDYALR
eukprot:scaffold264482_cov33-Tisochrysis_lutea.AAC.3